MSGERLVQTQSDEYAPPTAPGWEGGIQREKRAALFLPVGVLCFSFPPLSPQNSRGLSPSLWLPPARAWALILWGLLAEPFLVGQPEGVAWLRAELFPVW